MIAIVHHLASGTFRLGLSMPCIRQRHNIESCALSETSKVLLVLPTQPIVVIYAKVFCVYFICQIILTHFLMFEH